MPKPRIMGRHKICGACNRYCYIHIDTVITEKRGHRRRPPCVHCWEVMARNGEAVLDTDTGPVVSAR